MVVMEWALKSRAGDFLRVVASSSDGSRADKEPVQLSGLFDSIGAVQVTPDAVTGNSDLRDESFKSQNIVKLRLLFLRKVLVPSCSSRPSVQM